MESIERNPLLTTERASYCRIEYWKLNETSMTAVDAKDDWDEAIVVPLGQYTYGSQKFLRKDKDRMPALFRLLDQAFEAGQRDARQTMRSALGL